MADSARNRVWRPQLTKREQLRGWIFFALYFLVFPFLMAGVQWVFDQRWGLYLSDTSANLLYYGLTAALVFVVFWSFLEHGFFLLLDWLPENLFAFAVSLAGWLVLRFGVSLIPFPLENPICSDYALQYLMAPGATTVILVLLIPLVEEPFFRGLVFGGLRRTSRPLAYVLSALLFSFYSVWQYAFASGDWRYLLLFLEYLPAGLALTRCYDNGGSIWSAIALRMAINAITLYKIVN